MTGADRQSEVFCSVCEICGIGFRLGIEEPREPQNYDLTREQYQRVNLRLVGIMNASRIWERPKEIENQLEDARQKLRAAIEAVESLDNYAKFLARTEAAKERDAEFQKEFVRAVESAKTPEGRNANPAKLKERFPDPTPAEYVDHATVAQIKALSEALVRPIEAAIPLVQEGRGRPKNLRAYAVAEHAYLLFEELTGEKPTFWNARETTPFGRLVEYLFDAYGIKSTVRKPIEAAMHKFGVDG